MITTSQLMPTFNRVLAFDRELDRLVSRTRAILRSVARRRRARGRVLISAELPGVDPAAVEISSRTTR